jgi:hypothetical protein
MPIRHPKLDFGRPRKATARLTSKNRATPGAPFSCLICATDSPDHRRFIDEAQRLAEP